MVFEREAWVFYDVRTGKRLSMTSYLNQHQAEWDLDNLKRRDQQEKLRTHHIIPHIGIIQLTEETWGTIPGDIVDGRNRDAGGTT